MIWGYPLPVRKDMAAKSPVSRAMSRCQLHSVSDADFWTLLPIALWVLAFWTSLVHGVDYGSFLDYVRYREYKREESQRRKGTQIYTRVEAFSVSSPNSLMCRRETRTRGHAERTSNMPRSSNLYRAHRRLLVFAYDPGYINLLLEPTPSLLMQIVATRSPKRSAHQNIAVRNIIET
jgi:hypothetical protein